MNHSTAETVVGLNTAAAEDARYLAMLFDGLNMLVDFEGHAYEDVLIERALIALDNFAVAKMKPEQQRLIRTHRHYGTADWWEN